MAKYFGFGEYEPTDVGILQSTLQFRHEFLRILVQKKGNWARNLLQLPNFEKLSTDNLKRSREIDIFLTLLSQTFGRNRHKIEIPSDIFNTPLQTFISFIDEKKDDITKLDKDKSVVLPPQNTTKIKDYAIKQIIPKWEELKADQDAQKLCSILENWAEEYNLNQDWCLDCILLVLTNFVSSFTEKAEDLRRDKLDFNDPFTYFLIYESEIEQSLKEALSDFFSDQVLPTILDIDKELVVPPFIFQLNDMEILKSVWSPTITRRKKFVEETKFKFENRIKYIKTLNQYNLIDEKSCRNRLNCYCDEIEALQSQKLEIEEFPQFWDQNHNLLLSPTGWAPSVIDREKFVQNCLVEIKQNFEKIKSVANKINKLKKEVFDSEITRYCNKVKKSLPKNYSKTPVKYSEEKHFEWLIDYQITPTLEYKEILESIDIAERPKTYALINAIKRSSIKLGFSLRKGRRTGRPKGIIETQKRRRITK